MDLYLKLFANPSWYRWNLFLLRLAYKGLGIDQWKNVRVSGEQNFLKNILPQDRKVIFDIGAFHGSYSEVARLFHPHAKIYAFEPHPKSFKFLEQTARKMGFDAHQLGLGSSCCKATLYDVMEDGTAQASVYEEIFHACSIPTTHHEIQLTTLDAFCKTHAIDHIDLLKVDAEGFEYAVLEGAYRMIGSLSVDVIQFELNRISLISKKTLSDFLEMLSEYTFYRILYRGMIPLSKQQAEHSLVEHQNIIAWSKHARHVYDAKRNKTVCTQG